MLHAASRPIDDFLPDLTHDIVRKPVADVAKPHPQPPAPDRYGARSRPNIPVIAAILVLHILLIGALIELRTHVQRVQETKLTVVNLSPPPPPPSADTPPPPPSTPEIVAPPPIVQTPVQPVQTVQTTPDPVPVPTPQRTVLVTPTPSPAAVSPAPPSLIQGGDLSAQMIAGKPPRYPIESRRKREQGTVVLTLTLGVDGAVDSIAVSQSSGFARLDEAARDAVRKWRWSPVIRNGQPMRVRGVVEIPFVLRSDAA
ncbi:Ferric siderophore transport system, periplasmic binding protein TonB [Sphingobium indicum BiD32]|uniref:Ferric siderophore transport system, periplasmic binding protein TonB n=1 Tax=Sphingobium indicum BiD32 TaxID=1301087 RepID=N1MHN9_9SPHN|nr:energy transducer TonB [Sphingobium indicum]CCW16289.1 Ferric siderophore transport system, periplasmic binding protein TonB [Sphingobium indicum BiD32]